jgi:hypothetical protein
MVRLSQPPLWGRGIVITLVNDGPRRVEQQSFGLCDKIGSVLLRGETKCHSATAPPPVILARAMPQ